MKEGSESLCPMRIIWNLFLVGAEGAWIIFVCCSDPMTTRSASRKHYVFPPNIWRLTAVKVYVVGISFPSPKAPLFHASYTSPKWIDREGLRKRRTGTWQDMSITIAFRSLFKNCRNLLTFGKVIPHSHVMFIDCCVIGWEMRNPPGLKLHDVILADQ